jgi:hypothetical protein
VTRRAVTVLSGEVVDFHHVVVLVVLRLSMRERYDEKLRLIFVDLLALF